MISPVTAKTDATKPPRVRRWVPLSLRIFAVLLLLLGSGSVLWIGIPAYRQHLALYELTRVKANVQFVPHGPAWLRHRMGDKRMQSFDTVIGVHLHETGDADESLGSVRSLPELRKLNLCRSNVTDGGLSRIRNMKFLQLWLCNTSVTDAGLAHIGRLTRLRWLLLDGTQVTDAGLKQLTGLGNLEWLGLADTNVTAEGVAELQRALPRLNIYRELIAHPRHADRYLSTSNVMVTGAGGVPGSSIIVQFSGPNGVIYLNGSTTSNARGDWVIRLACEHPLSAGNYRLEYISAFGNRSSRPLTIVADPRHGTVVQNQLPSSAALSQAPPLPIVRLREADLAEDDGAATPGAAREPNANGADLSAVASTVRAGNVFQISGSIRFATTPAGGYSRVVLQVIEVVTESSGTQSDLVVSEDLVEPIVIDGGFTFRQTMVAPQHPGRYLVRAIYRCANLCEAAIEVKPSE